MNNRVTSLYAILFSTDVTVTLLYDQISYIYCISIFNNLSDVTQIYLLFKLSDDNDTYNIIRYFSQYIRTSNMPHPYTSQA